MRIDVLTLFPGAFKAVLNESILKRAQEKKKVRIEVHDIRGEATDRHRTCDDRPFGGGPGMVMKPEPIDRLARKLLGSPKKSKARFILLTPAGRRFSQKDAERLSKEKHLVLLSGRYEGIDERIRELWVDDEISIGDYVLSGGEIPAMVVIDAVVRLVPGVLGNAESKNFESFTGNLLEYPHYTRPEVFRGLAVPTVLLSGNHKAIEAWRLEQSRQRTLKRRPDLMQAKRLEQVRG